MKLEELSNISDSARIAVEVLIPFLTEINFPANGIVTTPEGGVGVFFRREVRDIVLTADIEIDSDGSITASVIPYVDTDGNLDVLQSEKEPIDLWDVEEEPPFEQTLQHIQARFAGENVTL